MSGFDSYRGYRKSADTSLKTAGDEFASYPNGTKGSSRDTSMLRPADVHTSVVKLRITHHGNMAGVSQTGPENKRGLIPCKASEAVKDVK